MLGLSVARTWRGLWRRPGLTLVTAATLAFGLATWLAGRTMVRAFGVDPLGDAAGLYRVQVDRSPELREAMRGTDMAFVSELPGMVLSSTEARAFARSPHVARSAAVTTGEVPVVPHGMVRACFLDAAAYELFRLAFAAGGPGALVIAAETAERWFGAEDAVGKPVEIGGETVRVTGVLARGTARGKRLHFADAAGAPELWLPYETASALGVLPALRHPTRGGHLTTSLWVELPDRSRAAYLASLGSPAARLVSYPAWRGVLGAPPAYRVVEIFATVTLLACLFAVMRLLATRLRLRTPALGVLAAVGAPRRAVIAEGLLEAALISALAVAGAIPLASLFLALIGTAMHTPLADFALGFEGLLLAPVAALASGLLAAAVPVWRTARLPPAALMRRT